MSTKIVAAKTLSGLERPIVLTIFTRRSIELYCDEEALAVNFCPSMQFFTPPGNRGILEPENTMSGKASKISPDPSLKKRGK
jgi:hypothetical protein